MSKYYFYNWEYISVYEQIFSSMLVLVSLLGTDSDPNQLFQAPNHQELNPMLHPSPNWQKTRPVIQFFGFVSGKARLGSLPLYPGSWMPGSQSQL